jgi:hypothetical protein
VPSAIESHSGERREESRSQTPFQVEGWINQNDASHEIGVSERQVEGDD